MEKGECYGIFPQEIPTFCWMVKEVSGTLVNGTNPGYHNGVLIVRGGAVTIVILAPVLVLGMVRRRLQRLPAKMRGGGSANAGQKQLHLCIDTEEEENR